MNFIIIIIILFIFFKKIKVNELKKYALLRNGYSESHPTIHYLWEVLESFN
jgi:hypothetical protein